MGFDAMGKREKIFFVPAAESDGPARLAEKTADIFHRLGQNERIKKNDFIALKIHFGEKDNRGYIKPEWLSGLISSVKEKTSRAFLTDTNTLYVGNRSNAVDHLQLAGDHGFCLDRLGIPVVIADGLIGKEGETVPLNKTHVREARIAGMFSHVDGMICLSHFTGHILI